MKRSLTEFGVLGIFLTMVEVLPVGSEVLSVVPHGKTRASYTLGVFFVDMMLISGLVVVRWAPSRHRSRQRGKCIFPEGKLFDLSIQSQSSSDGCFPDH